MFDKLKCRKFLFYFHLYLYCNENGGCFFFYYFALAANLLSQFEHQLQSKWFNGSLKQQQPGIISASYLLHGHIFTEYIKKSHILFCWRCSWGFIFPSWLETGTCLVVFFLFHRLFGGKQSKQAPVTTAENMKNSTVISNPHATLNQVAPLLESPDGGPEVGEGGGGGLLFGGGRVLGSGTGTLGSEPVSRKQDSNVEDVNHWPSHNSIYNRCSPQKLIIRANNSI